MVCSWQLECTVLTLPRDKWHDLKSGDAWILIKILRAFLNMGPEPGFLILMCNNYHQKIRGETQNQSGSVSLLSQTFLTEDSLNTTTCNSQQYAILFIYLLISRWGVFLNLPLWANFYNYTDLSHTTTTTTTFRPTNPIG